MREGLSLRHALEGEAEHHPNMPHRVLDTIVRPVAHRRLHRLKDVPRQQRDRHIPANLAPLRRPLEQPGHLPEDRGVVRTPGRSNALCRTGRLYTNLASCSCSSIRRTAASTTTTTC